MGKEDIIKVFDIYMKKIPAYEEKANKKKKGLEKQSSFLHPKGSIDKFDKT